MSGVTVPTMIASMSVGAQAALRQGFLGRFDGQIAGGDAFVHDMAFANADARHDPLVGGLDHFFQVGIGQQAGRDIGAEGADLGADRLGQCVPLQMTKRYCEGLEEESLTAHSNVTPLSDAFHRPS